MRETDDIPAAYQTASWLLAGLGLFLVLQAGLLGALLAGLLVHELVHSAAPALRLVGPNYRARKLTALVLLILIVGLLVGGAVVGLTVLIGSGHHNIVELMQRMADVIEKARAHFPPRLQEYLPATTIDLESAFSGWLRDHAAEIRGAGGRIGRTFFYIFVGMIIGGMVAYGDTRSNGVRGPLARALADRALILADAFRRIVYAQVRISAINTLFTAIYLAIVLPSFGVHLPFTKTMIVVTFIAGLIPLLGNLISNTVIVVVSLNASLAIAVSSIVFLFVIHKAEYFLNARIVGSKIRARAWELLVAMLVMEGCFGLAGLIAAPIYYAYLKEELYARGLI